ncbi:MAG: ribonuclease III [Lachnospiraceae bacterium]|jgi:ribonuclease-3 family protein|nr:ribonuclease III [Lachnospiraceae bacterium]MCX4317211.1 ribonuclease III [Lachnospiraceae bacterium]
MGAEEIKEENSELAARIKACFGEENQDIRTYSPLTLAYIGDAIYDLVIRTVLVGRGNAPVNTLHRQASSMVKAEAQKASLHQIEPLLSEEEKSVYRRGRNAKSYTTAKNASVGDYRIATGFEALLGYLYLTGQMERLLYLVKAGLEGTEA